MRKLAVVVLAAGRSSRFGSAKQLALIDGQPLITHSIQAIQDIDCAGRYVVLGANYDAIYEAVRTLPITILKNDCWSEGMASSIRLAAEELKSFDALLFLAADQVVVKAEQLNQLVRYWERHADYIVAASYAATLGIPAIFPSSYFDALASLYGDSGAKKIIRQNPQDVIGVEMPEALFDIDRISDLAPKS
ncbi:MAG: 4-diphosphocytidyl-2C-methyl-D-erythritol kinase [Porticoccaceae bacterium]|nr:MAG: 4-diphosphocytidyl-2C-methyl-D-erythritol kinase [Porticoccaceae bacterium]